MKEEDNNNLFINANFRGTGTFRLGKAYQVGGYIFLAASIGWFLLMSASEYEVIKYVFAAILAIFGIYMLLLFYISKVYLDSEKIVFYSFTGRKSELLWSDITSALIYYTNGRYSRENIDLCTDNKKITVGEHFVNYKSIRSTVKRKCRRASPLRKIEHGGTQVFKIDKAIRFLGISFIAFGILVAAVGIAADPALTSLTGIMRLGMLAPFTLLIGLAFLCSQRIIRVYVDAESITQINLFGVKKQITWPEIESVIFSYGYTRLSDIRLSGGGKTIVLNRYFWGFEAVEDIVRKYCPEKITA